MDGQEKWNSTEPLFPSVAVYLREILSNLYFAASALAPTEQRETDPELDARAAKLYKSYFQLLRLATNLSAASQWTEESTVTLQNVDLAGFLREICSRCASAASLMGIELCYHCFMQEHICAMNREGIERVVYQLLSNAFKFSEPGSCVTVELKQVGERLILTVSDTGCGISEELIPTLFDRFRHPDLMNPSPHGLGLGLSICRQIVEAHGGTIMAESKVGVGTHIVISLPDTPRKGGSLSDVGIDYKGGFNPTLLALSDVLPSTAFRMKYLD